MLREDRSVGGMFVKFVDIFIRKDNMVPFAGLVGA
jgi:hypothetical protein